MKLNFNEYLTMLALMRSGVSRIDRTGSDTFVGCHRPATQISTSGGPWLSTWRVCGIAPNATARFDAYWAI